VIYLILITLASFGLTMLLEFCFKYNNIFHGWLVLLVNRFLRGEKKELWQTEWTKIKERSNKELLNYIDSESDEFYWDSLLEFVADV